MWSSYLLKVSLLLGESERRVIDRPCGNHDTLPLVRELMNLSDEVDVVKLPDTLTVEDKWVLSKYNTLVKDVTENLEKFELGMAPARFPR